MENKRGLVGEVYGHSGSSRHIHILQHVLGQNRYISGGSIIQG